MPSKDEDEADRMLVWLKDQINEAWENTGSITPQYKGRKKPKTYRNTQASSKDKL